ncbi:MAG TPA: tetraacyldisaccharide 4'-kinase, partial [Candidatus Eisenbacteria bacterium]|nr:tetraacyldisaccharide 4'-kinase [Candidatus Eisenbacteria bacterium]
GGVWTAALLRPLEALYAVVSDAAQARAGRSRRPVPGLTVVAIGGLTVGGAGKTTLARWAARTALAAGRRPAIVLRGYGAEEGSEEPRIVPPGAPEDPAAARRYGDEAVAHRAALPAGVVVATGRDRRCAARMAQDSGADVVVLDDGWEQSTLAWDHLWVVVEARRPFGNGRRLPAGPLRRRIDNLCHASAIVEIDEAVDEGEPTITVAGWPTGALPPRIRFRRRVESWRRLSVAGGAAPPDAAASPPAGVPILLISSVGAPDRLERFLRGAGAPPSEHLAFPDHAPWDPAAIAEAAAAFRRRPGPPGVVVVTDKDAARAARLAGLGLDIWVVHSEFAPIGDPALLLAALARRPGRADVAARPPIG